MKQTMAVGTRYVVTKASKDRTFLVGDHIRLLDDGSIVCREAMGWIDKEYVPAATKGMEFEIDREWIEARKAKLREELEALG